MQTLHVQSRSHSEMIDITAQVAQAVSESRVGEGICLVYVPHTTAGVTINENADADVPRDILAALEKAVPWKGDYRHTEGNAAAHVKASLVGSSVSVLVHDGRLVLGTWQGIFFCEFDGPRRRKVFVRVLSDSPGSSDE